MNLSAGKRIFKVNYVLHVLDHSGSINMAGYRITLIVDVGCCKPNHALANVLKSQISREKWPGVSSNLYGQTRHYKRWIDDLR